MNNISEKIAKASVTAALYAAATLLISPLSYGVFQIRISEALICLCAFEPSAVAGIAAGCFLANIIGPNGIIDAVIGSLASLAGAFFMYKLRKRPFIAFLPNVIINGVAIGLELVYFYNININPALCMLYVAAGEAAACYGAGLPLLKLIEKRGGKEIL